MFGKDNNVFWVKLSRDEYENAKKKPIFKSVRLGETTQGIVSLKFKLIEWSFISTYF